MAKSYLTKTKAIARVKEVGLMQASREFNISVSSLRNWIETDNNQKDLYTRHINRLQVENNKLRKANDILLDLVTSQQIRLDKYKAEGNVPIG